MRQDLIGSSPQLHARIAGLAGIATLTSGSFAGIVASKLIVAGDTAATARNIVASETLFRLGIAGNLVMMLAYLGYALLLYGLLRPVSRSLAMTMLALVLAAVPIYMLNQVNQLGALLSASEQRLEDVKAFFELNRFGNLIAAIFFGLWLFPLGLLVFRSGFFPRVLGVLLMAGTPGYLVLFVQVIFFPGSLGGLWSNPFLVLTHLAELAMMFWLLIRGVNAGLWEKRAT